MHSPYHVWVVASSTDRSEQRGREPRCTSKQLLGGEGWFKLSALRGWVAGLLERSLPRPGADLHKIIVVDISMDQQPNAGRAEWHEIDARTSQHTLRNAATTIAVVCAVTSVAFHFAEPGECTPETDAVHWHFLSSDEREAWTGHRCYSNIVHDQVRAAEADIHADDCPLGFSCRGVGRSFMHSLYFVVVTTTTVGYGDVTPHTDAGRLLAVLLIVVNIAFLTTLATVLAEALQAKAERHAEALEKAARESELAGKSFRHLDNLLSGVGGTEEMKLTRAIGRRLLIFVVYVLLGTVAFAFLEEWDVVQSLYFSVVTVSSVGYGDMVLTGTVSRAFGMVYATYGIFGTVALAGQCTELYLEQQTAQRMKAFSGQDVAAVFGQIDTDHSGSIDRHEYLEFMLIRSGKVKVEDLELIRESFNSLDKDGDGEISLDEIKDALQSDGEEE